MYAIDPNTNIRIPVKDCLLCQSLESNPNATRCSICNKALCVDHIDFEWDANTKKAKAYYCEDHRK